MSCKKLKKILSKVSTAKIELKFIKKFQVEPKSLNLNTTTRKYTKKNYPICFDGFRSICPVTSQPDFAKIYILSSTKIETKWLRNYYHHSKKAVNSMNNALRIFFLN